MILHRSFPNGAINLAVVPDSDPELPITISSVNNTLNSEYYINNPSNIDVCSDGFTVNLTVSNTVLCGETYHIKLAIADGFRYGIGIYRCFGGRIFRLERSVYYGGSIY